MAKKTVAIIGVGLIGGSLGQALRRSGRYRVLGIGRHARKLREARRRGAIDRLSMRIEDAAVAQVIVIASPVERVIPTIRKLLPHLRPGTIVTDVSSVKGAIEKGVARLRWPKGVFFVGAHPLAGSHRTGVTAARPDLFKGATCVLVPFHRAPLQPVSSLWKTAGARTMVLTASAHDEAVALISHLPHVVAHTLNRLVRAHPRRKILLPLLAGSFRDMTRVASSDPDQWAQILQANGGSVRRAIRAFERELRCLDRTLTRASLRLLLRQSHAFRRPLFNGI